MINCLKNFKVFPRFQNQGKFFLEGYLEIFLQLMEGRFELYVRICFNISFMTICECTKLCIHLK